MEATSEVRAPNNIVITKWKVKEGFKVAHGAVLFLYDSENAKGLKMKANEVGTVADIIGKVDENITSGSVVMRLQSCNHPTVMKDMCADCGADLREEMGLAGDRKEPVSASVAMIHSIPELIVSEEQALELGKADENRLMKTRKLVLLVDLDQTLIHTTNDNIPANLKDVYHFQLPHGNSRLWYHTRLRPGTQRFLETVSKLYELHICTFGVRLYAHTIAGFLDPEGKYFSHRILSRDECFNQNSKTANLKALFPCGDSMVCIIDDREDVWNFSPNLIHVKPYRFFQGTADINAPPGLSKNEKDNEPVTHKVRRVSKSTDSSDTAEKSRSSDTADNSRSSDTPDNSRSSDTPDNSRSSDTADNSRSSDTPDNSRSSDTPDNSRSSDTTDNSKDKGSSVDSKTDSSDTLPCDSTAKADVSEVSMECSVVPIDRKSDMQEETSVFGQITDKSDESNSKVEDMSESSKVNCRKTNSTSDTKTESMNSFLDKDCVQDEQLNEIDNSASEQQVISSSSELQRQCEAKSSSLLSEKQNAAETCKTESEDVNAAETCKTESEDVNADKAIDKLEQNSAGAEEKSEFSEDKNKGEEEIEWDDEDDYLMYLEDILVRIHRAFYNLQDQIKNKNDGQSKESPDLKNIIPYVKRKVLKGTNIVFSGVFPTNIPPEKSRAYIVAKALGANIQTNIVPKVSKNPDATTHVVAAFCGTAKVRTAQKARNIKIVNSNWLWNCAERYEHVDERLYPLSEEKYGARDSPDVILQHNKGSKRKAAGSVENSSHPEKKNKTEAAKGSREERFSSSYNPLFAFSDEDIAYMDKEVEEIMEEDDDDSDEDDVDRDSRMRNHVLSTPPSSSDEDSLAAEFPKGWKVKGRKSSGGTSNASSSDHEVNEGGEESADDLTKFEKTVEAFAPDDTASSDDDESIGSVDDEMAAAVEREFLSQL